MFADVCVCFGRFEIIECVQCWVQVTFEVVGYNTLVMSRIERRHGYQQLGDSHNYDT